MSKSLGSWLLENKHNKIYLYAKNCPEWTTTDIACWNYGITNIPLYDTLGAEAFFHIIKLT
jgi:long-subunit acyl-CoA synthetase (AMP-forming)